MSETTMSIATIFLSALLAVGFLISGGLKVDGIKQSLQVRDRLRVGERLWTLIGVFEGVGAGGLLVGLIPPPIGVPAAAGLGLLMAGAIGAHVRVSDSRNAAPAAFLMALSVAVAILHITAM